MKKLLFALVCSVVLILLGGLVPERSRTRAAD